MVEIDRRLSGSEFPKLVVPETRKLTNEDVASMFGNDYKKLVKDKAEQFGITDLQFFDSPLPHKGSQAVYLVEEFVGDDLILVAVLGTEKETSRHFHVVPMGEERYFHIKGKSVILIDGQENPLDNEHPSVNVTTNVFHQVRTQESPSLTLIIMENAALVKGPLHITDE